ncbi:hypothetical protein [Neorhizobium alkalisoli]|uniref:hypothetical protein n=1 Tax=Neorhizobium alkalisoli TaxID=528178 RepID=UPI00131A2868|nr:hypothetical protein [Neorhizobium alkalisoli]
MYPSDRTLHRFIRMAPQATSVVAAIRKFHPYSMLSDEEVFFLNALCSTLSEPARVAELGCYVGGTTCIFGEATPAGSVVEVYDLFLHNGASRQRLRDDPLFQPESFFGIWERNTAPYKDKVSLNRGDLLETCKANIEPLDIAYVDIVKHPSLINAMMHFYSRVKLGGLVLHQDYFHWQSPWLVYQMEYLRDYFDLIGDVGHNMAVYRKSRSLDAVKSVDFLTLPVDEIFELFDRAIDRYKASKAGMLKVSKLRLALEIAPERQQQITSDIETNHSDSPRVVRYLRALQASQKDLKVMW